jgi:hypothetical protein
MIAQAGAYTLVSGGKEKSHITFRGRIFPRYSPPVVVKGLKKEKTGILSPGNLQCDFPAGMCSLAHFKGHTGFGKG